MTLAFEIADAAGSQLFAATVYMNANNRYISKDRRYICTNLLDSGNYLPVEYCDVKDLMTASSINDYN